jgi:ATP-dependent DNA helicase RecG
MTVLLESDTLELKEEWTDRVYDSVAAFANTEGGRVLLGVRDDGSIKGFDVSDKNQRDISGRIADRLRFNVPLYVLEQDGKTILELLVPSSSVLITCSGRYLTRVGTTNRDMTPAEIQNRSLRNSGQSWDTLVAPGTSPESVSDEAVEEFRYLSYRKLPYARNSSKLELLGNLGLLRENMQLSRAAVLAFGVSPKSVSTGAELRVARFENGQLAEGADFSGSLFLQLRGILEWLRPYLFTRFEIPNQLEGQDVLDALQRREVWQVPYDALREAVLNALIHRDYTLTSDIQVRLEKTYLEIWSPGGLPAGMTLEMLEASPHPSIRRNPVLADIFLHTSLIERWGTGIGRIKNAFRERGLPAPTFEEYAQGMRVVLPRDTAMFIPTSNPINVSKDQPLNPRQQKVLDYLDTHDQISREEYEALTASSKSAAIRDLRQLVREGLLEKIGSSYTTAYRKAR